MSPFSGSSMEWAPGLLVTPEGSLAALAPTAAAAPPPPRWPLAVTLPAVAYSQALPSSGAPVSSAALLGFSAAPSSALSSMSGGLVPPAQAQFSFSLGESALPSPGTTPSPTIRSGATPTTYGQTGTGIPSAAPVSTVIKAVCSSGGSFVRASGGGWLYEGGETRLVSVPFACSAGDLFTVLERATSGFSESSDLRSDTVRA